MNCEDFKDQFVELSMGTLDASQRARLIAHLESGCAECNAFLKETRQTLTSLPLSLEPVKPPAAARDRLLARITAEPTPMRIGPSTKAPASRGSGIFQALAGGAIAAGIMGAIFWHVSDNQNRTLAALQTQLDETRATLGQVQSSFQTKTNQLETSVQHTDETMQRTNESLQRANDTIQRTSEAVLRTNEAVEMMRSPGVQMVSLQGTEVQPKAKARAYYDAQQSTVHFYAADVKPAATGKAYELWLITAKGASKAGMFDVDQAARGIAIAVPSTADKIVKFAVTEEPAAGSLQPTSAVMLIGDVQ